jgi:hypothetical protein
LAYVGEPFRHDIFVSYSHGSDVDGEGTHRGWSLAFVRELEREMRADRAFRDTLSLFVDSQGKSGQRIDPMSPLTDQLTAHAAGAALLLVLLTPDYQASDWCRAEREWWWAQQRRNGVAPEGRVGMVRAWPVPAEWPGGAWPPELSDGAGQPLVGWRFHAGDGRAARPLGWTQWQVGFSPDVRESLLTVVGELLQKLDGIKADLERQATVRADAQRLADAAGQTLYVHGRADRATDWERAAVALADGGYAVLPGEPDPVERDAVRQEAIRQQRVETLTACDALVLVGSQDGRAIDADLIVVGKHDRHSARARCNKWLPCALLDTVGPPVATSVRRNTARIVQTDWLDATTIPAVTLVRQWLTDKATVAAQR